MITDVLDDPPEISLLELHGSIIESRSVFLYVREVTLFCCCVSHLHGTVWFVSSISYLPNVARRRRQSNGNRLITEPPPIQLKKLKKHLPKVMLGYQTSALNLWHQLQHAHYETDDGEASNTAVHRFVKPSHHKEMLDEGHEDRHRRVVLLPLKKRINGADTSKVLEGNIHAQTGHLVNELDERDSSVGNNLDRMLVSNSLAHQ